MAIEFVGSATATAIDGGSPAVSLTALTGGIDTRPRKDDIILAFGAVPSNTAGIDWSGYTLIDEANNSANTARGAIYYKISDGTETTATFTGDAVATSSVGAMVMVFRGVDTATPQDAAAVAATGSSTNPDAPSITPVTNEAVVVAFAFSLVNDATITVPSGYAGLTTVNAGADTNDVSMAAAYLGGRNQSTAEDPAAFTGWSTASWRAVSVALRPAATRLTYVGSTFGFAINGGNPTLDLTALTGGAAAAAIEGDLVIVIGGHSDAANAGVSTSGFTEIVDTGTTAHLSISWKIMGAVPDTTINCIGSGDANDGVAYCCMVWRGADPARPIDVTTTTATGTSTTPDSPSITPGSDDVAIISAVLSATFGGTLVRPQHFCRTVNGSADDTSDATAAMSYRTNRFKGAINPPSWTGFTSGTWTAATIAVRPKIQTGGGLHHIEQGMGDTGPARVPQTLHTIEMGIAA